MVLRVNILNTLEELEEDDFKSFKWYLQDEHLGHKPIPKYKLETADRRVMADLMVGFYAGVTAQIVQNILKQINKNDLVQSFAEAVSRDVVGSDDIGKTKGSSVQSFQSPSISPGSAVYESSGGGGEDEELARSPSQAMLLFSPPSRTCSKRARYAYVAVAVAVVVAAVVVVWVSVFAGVPQPPGPGPGNSTNRGDFLKYSCQLSLDVNTVNNILSLYKENRQVSWTGPGQHYPEDPQRFTSAWQVLSKESLSERCYFEVKWFGGRVGVAVSYIDINRKEMNLSRFGNNDKSWMLWWDYKTTTYPPKSYMYSFYHDSIETKLFGPYVSIVGSVGDGVWGVYVDHRAGTVSFYQVDKDTDTQTLLYTVNTTFTQPLYAGIWTINSAEVCKIW